MGYDNYIGEIIDSGESTLLTFRAEMIEYDHVNRLLFILNRLGIPYKRCWSGISINRETKIVNYHHTNMNF